MGIEFDKMLLELSLKSAERHFGEVREIFQDQADRAQKRIDQYKKDNPTPKKSKKVTKKVKKSKR